jgi:hypothetical protein
VLLLSPDENYNRTSLGIAEIELSRKGTNRKEETDNGQKKE